MNEQELLRRLREAFAIEAEERLNNLSSDLMTLEEQSVGFDPNLLEQIYRDAHSLKGAARAVDEKHIESVCMAMEGLLGGVKQQQVAVDAHLYDLLHESVTFLKQEVKRPQPSSRDRVTALIERLEEGSVSKSVPAGVTTPTATTELVNDKDARTHTPPPGPVTAPELPPGPFQEPPQPLLTTTTPPQQQNGATKAALPSPSAPPLALSNASSVRVLAYKLDELLHCCEEMIGVRQRIAHRTELMAGLNQTFEIWQRRNAKLRGKARHYERLMGDEGQGAIEIERQQLKELVDHIGWSQGFIAALQRDTKTLLDGIREEQLHADRSVDELMEEMKDVLLQPASTLTTLLPPMVREISRTLGKQLTLSITGDEIEIDRRILDEMRDPLIHLVRNAIDHGLELPAERQRLGKEPQGQLQIEIRRLEGGQIELVVSDDGRGIDGHSLIHKAVTARRISADVAATLDEKAALELIFLSGLSTAELITNISGRGLGMSIVQDAVERLGGGIELVSELGVGSCFRMRLPTSLAVFRGIFVRAGGATYLLPSHQTVAVQRIPIEQVRYTENRPTILFQQRPLSVVGLDELLGLHQLLKGDERVLKVVVVMGAHNRRLALRVDEVMGEEEVLIKGLGPQLRQVRFFSGATILPSGAVIPLLNIKDLLERAGGTLQGSGVIDGVPLQPEREGATSKQTILLVEDSITSRILIKNILEAEGYQVITAVDGMEGLSTLKISEVDLVVSDVEMPRMDGFELTRNIRAHPRLAELPVVLVTSLAAREDREQGVEAGANAYIIKGNFDQSNLLETIGRLI